MHLKQWMIVPICIMIFMCIFASISQDVTDMWLVYSVFLLRLFFLIFLMFAILCFKHMGYWLASFLLTLIPLKFRCIVDILQKDTKQIQSFIVIIFNHFEHSHNFDYEERLAENSIFGFPWWTTEHYFVDVGNEGQGVPKPRIAYN